MKLWRLYKCLITHLLNDYGYDFKKEIHTQLFYRILKNTVASIRTCFGIEWKITDYSHKTLTLYFNSNMLLWFLDTLFQKIGLRFPYFMR